MSRRVGGCVVIEVKPGAPLPAGVPAWAERCDMVQTPDLPAERRPWVLGAGVFGTAASIVAMAFGETAIVPLVFSLMLLHRALGAGMTTVLTPSPSGRYVAFEDGADPEENDKAMASRAVAVAAGPVAMGLALLLVFTGTDTWVDSAALALFGCYALYRAVTGADVRDDADRPASLRFRALADPTRPLAEFALTTSEDGWTSPPESPGTSANPSGIPESR